MTVSSYLFQSPYSQPFQVGQPDPAMKQEESQQNQKEEAKVETKAQNPVEKNNSFDQLQTEIKSSTLYANSEGFGMSSEQLSELSSASKNVKRSDLVRVYSNSGE